MRDMEDDEQETLYQYECRLHEDPYPTEIVEAESRADAQMYYAEHFMLDAVLQRKVRCVQRGKPHVQLSGTDGNVFSIIGLVSNALKHAGQEDRAAEFRHRATNAKSYTDIIGSLVHEYVDVS